MGNIKTVEISVSDVIHDITNTLASVRISAHGLDNILPELIKGYQLAVEHNLIDSNIQDNKFHLIEKFPKNIKDAVNSSFDIINGINLNKNLSIKLFAQKHESE